MSSARRFNNAASVFCLRVITAILLCLNLPGTATAETFTVTGNIIRGSCVINMADKDVVFNQLIETTRLTTNTSDTTYTVPFTFQYKCAGFDVSSGQPVQMIKITPAGDSLISTDNKIYPGNSNQNAGFVLRQCGQGTTGCQLVTFTSSAAEIPSVVTHNGELETQFEVSIVKVSDQPAKPGDLVAAVDLTLLQP